MPRYKGGLSRSEDKVKALVFILTLPCSGHRNEDWAERTSWELTRNLPKGAKIRWMWKRDKGDD